MIAYKTHLVYEFTEHAVPSTVDERAMKAVVHQLDRVGEVAELGNLFEHLHAEASVLVVAIKCLIVLRYSSCNIGRLLIANTIIIHTITFI